MEKCLTESAWMYFIRCWSIYFVLGRESRALLLCPAVCMQLSVHHSNPFKVMNSLQYISLHQEKDMILLFFLSGKPFLKGGQGCPRSNAISCGNFKEGDDYLQLTEDICAGTLTPYLIDYPRFAQPQPSPGPQLNRCHG